jgi:hypothetical protein
VTLAIIKFVIPKGCLKLSGFNRGRRKIGVLLGTIRPDEKEAITWRLFFFTVFVRYDNENLRAPLSSLTRSENRNIKGLFLLGSRIITYFLETLLIS